MEQVSIVMVPFSAQGHLNQLLHFTMKLSSHGFPLHFACSESHIRQAKSRIHGWNSTSFETIHFHHLPLPPFSTPPPDPNATFPDHLIPSFEAMMKLRAPLASLFRSVSANCRRLVVIYDPAMSFVSADVAELANGESFRFQCVPSFMELHYYFQHVVTSQVKPRQEALDVFMDPFEGNSSSEVTNFLTHNNLDAGAETGTLYNTCRVIEGEFLDILARVPRFHGKKQFAVGPINPLAMDKSGGGASHECLEWLDKQSLASVIYISFGSTTTMSEEQIEQLATGLQRSGQRFIWVLRDADLGDIYADKGENRQEKKLPSAFEEKVEGIGMVVRGWAPQLHILAHPSTGGFMSHCGWNSCMESLSMGVPIMAWPMHSDQPRNAVMVTGYLKAGVAVREWAQHKKVVSSDQIEESIKKLMVDEEGKEIKKRTKLLGEAIRLSAAEGGSSRAELDSLIAHITR